MIFRILLDIGIFGLCTSTISAILAVVGLVRFLRAGSDANTHGAEGASAWTGSPAPAWTVSPVSLLKPLDGDEPNLEAHLESFFDQDYPRFEILFCTRSASDPGLAAARRVAARYPHIPARFLSTGDQTYINAKVSSLELMHASAQHDIFIISDSDVRVRPDYLRTVMAPLADPKIGAVTSFYLPIEERTFVDRLQSVGMMSDFYVGIVVAWQLDGVKFALGPSIATTRERLAAFGGYQSIENRPGDDLLVGRLIADQGYEVELSR